MKLSEALGKFGPVRGTTSVLAGLMSGDMAPISGHSHVAESLAEAKDRLAAAKKAQDECKSDWAYWGYQGDVSYWKAVVSLLEAAEITGPDNLPEVHFDDSAGVVMDQCGKQEDFGRAVLNAARAASERT